MLNFFADLIRWEVQELQIFDCKTTWLRKLEIKYVTVLLVMAIPDLLH